MLHKRLFDQVLQELNAGNMHEGINMLVGMLDMVDQRPEFFGAACDELRRHPLAAMLREDPLFSRAPMHPGNETAVLHLIATGDLPAGVSPTGRRLFSATSKLKLSRALRGRHLAAGQRVARAWQHGRGVCLLGGGLLDAAQALAGRDLRNITVVEADQGLIAALRARFGSSFSLTEASPAQFLRSADGTGQFDVICSTELADTCTSHGLAALMPAMLRHLASDGSIELAALVPHHPGCGWRRAYLDWEPCCHAAESLAATAAAAGLSPRVYSDETSCVVWCQMSAIPGRQANSFQTSQAAGGMS